MNRNFKFMLAAVLLLGQGAPLLFGQNNVVLADDATNNDSLSYYKTTGISESSIPSSFKNLLVHLTAESPGLKAVMQTSSIPILSLDNKAVDPALDTAATTAAALGTAYKALVDSYGFGSLQFVLQDDKNVANETARAEAAFGLTDGPRIIYQITPNSEGTLSEDQTAKVKEILKIAFDKAPAKTPPSDTSDTSDNSSESEETKLRQDVKIFGVSFNIVSKNTTAISTVKNLIKAEFDTLSESNTGKDIIQQYFVTLPENTTQAEFTTVKTFSSDIKNDITSLILESTTDTALVTEFDGLITAARNGKIDDSPTVGKKAGQ